jgi:hypothetical protein
VDCGSGVANVGIGIDLIPKATGKSRMRVEMHRVWLEAAGFNLDEFSHD